MTDNDLLARLDDAFEAPAKPRDWQALARDAAAALRACDIDLAAARTAAQHLLASEGLQEGTRVTVSRSSVEQLRAWLASVSPPATGEEP